MLAVAAAPIALHLQGCSEEDDGTNRVGAQDNCCGTQTVDVEGTDKNVLYCGLVANAPSIAMDATCENMKMDVLIASMAAVLGSDIEADEVEIFSAKGNFVGAEDTNLFETLSTFTSVEVIDIQDSNLDSLPNIEWLPKSCAVLDLTGNDLEEVVLTGKELPGPSTDISILSILNLGNNEIKDIKISNMFALSAVDLSENHFKTFDKVDLGEAAFIPEQLSVNLSNQHEDELDVVTITNEPTAIWVSQFIKDLNICGNGETEGDYVCDTTPEDVAETPSDLFFEVVAHFFKTDCCPLITVADHGADDDSIFCGGDLIADNLGLEHCRNITTFDVVASLPVAMGEAAARELTIKEFTIKADLSSGSSFIFGFFLDEASAVFWSALKLLDMQKCSLVALPEEAWIPKSVELLELDENKLQDVTFTSQGGDDKLKTLELSNNGLKKFEIKGFGELEELNVSQNALASFDDLAIWAGAPANNLQSVNLSGQVALDVCSIGSVTAAWVPNLDNINICGPTTDGALFECDTEKSGTPEELVGAVLSDPLCA
jgi:hypothetical protein